MERTFSRIILQAGAASQRSVRQEMTLLRQYTMSLRVTVTSPNLVAAFAVRGSDFDDTGANDPVILGTGNFTVLPAGVTFDAATGVFTFSSPAAGTHVIGMTWWWLPKWVSADWTYTSGGGTVTADVALSGWS